MAKFVEVFEDTQELFDKVISDAQLEQNVNIKVLANNSLKQIGKVVKANELLKHMTTEDVVIIVNDLLFENLEDEQKKMVAEELVAQIYFNAEKSTITLVKPDINTYSLLLDKYGYDKYLRLQLTIKSLLGAEAENEPQTNQAE